MITGATARTLLSRNVFSCVSELAQIFQIAPLTPLIDGLETVSLPEHMQQFDAPATNM
jgi:hypothetical protein